VTGLSGEVGNEKRSGAGKEEGESEIEDGREWCGERSRPNRESEGKWKWVRMWGV
jgi:hypothetical protein